MPHAALADLLYKEADFDLRHTRRAGWDDFDNLNVAEQYPPDLDLEPVHLDIDLFIDIANRRAVGAVTNTVRANREGATQIKLNALDFEAVQVTDPDGNALRWQYDGQLITVRWQQPFAAGEERRLRVAYAVTNPVDGLFFSQPDAACPQQGWYATTDHETERARHWLPCVDLPNVRTTLDFHLRAEARFTIVANGYQVEEIMHETGELAGAKTAHWRLDQRCPSYLVCFVIGELTVAEDGAYVDGDQAVPCTYYCSADHSAADLLRTFGRTKAMLAWMTRKLDMAFPYPKYAQYALPKIGGAMENISLVSWDERWVQSAELAPELGWFIDQVNVHEMSHAYFGDAIVCRDFAHGWLKESWATYVEQLWREDNYAIEEAHYVYHMNAVSYFAEADDEYMRPIVTRRFRSSWDMYDAHLYEGGACRLHTLRCEIGDDPFWAATRAYLKRYAEKVVETDDFRRLMEEFSGRSLGRFFEQWFYAPGYPELKVSFDFDDERQLGTFKIEQKQVDAAKHIPVFRLVTEVGWEDAEGEWHTQPVTLEQPVQFVTIPMTAEPQQVRFDPNMKVLHKLEFNPGSPMLRRQLTHAPDIIGRILAAQELIKSGRSANVQAVLDAYANEPFWGVRRRMVHALGAANSETALAGLVQIIATEQDPLVLDGVLRAAGNYRDARIQAAVEQRLAMGLPPLATQAAYAALGAQRRAAPLNLLLEASQRPTINGFAQAGALSGLAATRQARALEMLLERVDYGVCDEYARPAAVSALAAIGKGQEKAAREQVSEALTDLLRDPWQRVHRAAANGLGAMQAAEALDALAAYGRRVTNADAVRVERTMRAIRQADKEAGSALQSEIDGLQDKIRKLEERLERVSAHMNLPVDEDD
ncbi:MAG: M1 family aminopeptidase [Caldilineaceae bacterium]